MTGGFAGGLRRLTSASSVASAQGNETKKEEQAMKVEPSSVPLVSFLEATSNHVSIVKDVVEHHFRTRHQTEQHVSENYCHY